MARKKQRAREPEAPSPASEAPQDDGAGAAAARPATAEASASTGKATALCVMCGVRFDKTGFSKSMFLKRSSGRARCIGCMSAGAYAFPERRDEVYRNVERASALFRALERRSQRAPLLLGDEELLATYDFGEDAAGAAQEMHDWQRNYGAATATAEQPFGDVRSLAPVSLRALDESCTAWLRGYTRTAYAFVSERIAEVRQSVAAQTALALEAMENVSASLFFSEARDCITLRVMVRGIDATRDILVPLQMPISGFLFYVFEYVTPHISPDLAVMRLPWMAWHRAHAPSNPLIPLLELASSLPTSKGAKNKRPSTFAALLNSECHRLGLDRNATSFRLADYFLTLRLQNYWAIRSTTPMRNSTIGELESRRAVPASPGASASAQAVAVQ